MDEIYKFFAGKKPMPKQEIFAGSTNEHQKLIRNRIKEEEEDIDDVQPAKKKKYAKSFVDEFKNEVWSVSGKFTFLQNSVG